MFLNILLYACVVVLLGYELYLLLIQDTLPSYLTSVILHAVSIRVLVIIPTLICIFGLLTLTNWGRKAAVYWNVLLAIFIGVFPFLAAILSAHFGGGNITDFLPLGMRLIGILFSTLLLLAMAAAMQSSSVRDYFQPA
ncbi:MAG: hypothetical protein U1E13_07860 [Methylophilaceae bacterium]|nr:hypothetical protein [Methylophilaceae bacterium]